MLIDGAYVNNKAIIEVVANPNSEANDKAFVKKLRTLYNQMLFPSTSYNAYSKMSGDSNKSVTTWTEPERIVVLLRADVLAEIDVEVLAAAFNMDKADFIGRVIAVDNFGSPEILGAIMDESFLQIYQNQFRFDEFYNARTMSWNYYLHAWDTFAISPFANAVILATAESKPATAITLGTISNVTVGSTQTGTITVTPADSTSVVTAESSNTEVATVEVTENGAVVTGVAAGTVTITVKTDNGLSDSQEVTVVSGQ